MEHKTKRWICKFYQDFGRQGDLSGVFLANELMIDNVIGTTIYLGEVLGKHSDVEVTIQHQDIIKITDDPVAIDVFERYNLESGINPFDYIEDE